MPVSKRPTMARCVCALLLAGGTGLASAQAPVAEDDAYTVNVNGLLSVAAGSGLLANDTGFSATTHRIEQWDARSRFGAVVVVAADGSFSYDPPAGFRGLDSFTYTLRNAFGATRATVGVDVSGNTVWFVNGSAAGGGDGTFGSPFNGFAPVNSVGGSGDVDAAGDTIFVHQGVYDVAFDLEIGQRLIGHSAGLDLIGTANDIAPTMNAPQLRGSTTAPIVELFGAGGTVRGFEITSSNGRAIQGNTIQDVTLADIDVTLMNAAGAIELTNVSGNNVIDNIEVIGSTPVANSALSFVGSTGTIQINRTTVRSFNGGYVLHVGANGGTISFDAASSLVSTATRGLRIATQTSSGVVSLAGVDVRGGVANEPLVWLQGNHALSTVNFDGGLAVGATAAGTAALSSGGGRLRIAGSGAALSADAGPVLDLTGVELTQNATLASLASTNSPARGINIVNPVGNNDIAVSGATTVSGSTLDAVRIDADTASGFALSLGVLSVSGGTTGVAVRNAAVATSDASSSIVTTAGPAIRCTSATANLALAGLMASGGTRGVSFDGCSGNVSAVSGSLSSTGSGNHVVDIGNTAGTNTLAFTYGGLITKLDAGGAVRVVGLVAPGAVTFGGGLVMGNTSSGIVLTDNAGPVTFSTLLFGGVNGRFTAPPLTLSNNTGAVDLGIAQIHTSGIPALNIAYANANPGLVTTRASSLLDTSGASPALVVSHATNQPLSLAFQNIVNTGAGSHGIDIDRASGTLVVSGLANLGAKTTAGVEITNSSLVTSIKELDITGARDGVRLANNTGSFTLLGDGNFVNSHTDGAGGNFSNLLDNAFDLDNVTNVRATDLVVTGTGGHGVTGTGVTGTTIFSNVDFSNIGNADNEHVFDFREGAVSGAQVTGSLEINNSVIQNFTDNGVYLENFSGTLDFHFTNNVLRNNITTTACGGSNCNGNGILLRADGTSRINAILLNAAFENIDGIGLTANPEGTSGARMDINVVQSAFTAAAYGGPGHTNNGETAISLRNAQGNGTLNFHLYSNDIYNYSGEFALGVVEIEGGDFTTTHGVVDALYIYDAHFGEAVGVLSDGANSGGSGTTDYDLILSFNGMNIAGTTMQYGSAFRFAGNGAIAGSDANAQITLSDNILTSSPARASSRTVDLTLDAGSPNFNRACFNVAGNNIAAGSNGLASIDLRYIGNTQVRLQDMVGTGDVNARNRLDASNTLGNPSSVGTLNNITSAVCTTPTLPAAFPFN